MESTYNNSDFTNVCSDAALRGEAQTLA